MRGIGMVARHELRGRLLTGPWLAVMAVWFVVVNGLGVLYRLGLAVLGSTTGGVSTFGAVLVAVLVLTLAMVPALAAQATSLERGTPARATAADLALGRFAAVWAAGTILLALAFPCLALPVLEGAVGIGRAVVVITVAAVLVGVVSAISVMWSAVLGRAAVSALAAYLSLFVLLAGPPAAFQVAAVLVDAAASERRADLVWWLQAPQPVLVMADAAPRPDGTAVIDGTVTSVERADPLTTIGKQLRQTRVRDGDSGGGPVWPYGLAFDLALAAGALWFAARRVRLP
ncbi:hypothetical protein [Spirillospora sp. CA-294931]|uniref:hypothetical protein n=1 Tax=Spirillospora sp. CA-294931 TaxID=3240042 RepID=UPI003D8A1AD3